MKNAILCRKNYKTWDDQIAYAAIMTNYPIASTTDRIVEVMICAGNETWLETARPDTQNGEVCAWRDLPKHLHRRVRAHVQLWRRERHINDRINERDEVIDAVVVDEAHLDQEI
jgi:hypothetical protein